jgi:hypothetical protein
MKNDNSKIGKEIFSEIQLFLSMKGGDVELQKIAKERPNHLYAYSEKLNLEIQIILLTIQKIDLIMAKALSDIQKGE